MPGSRPTDGRDGRLLRYANAGHLPPILQYPDGTARLLEDGQSVLIGAPGGHARTEALEPMPTGSTLLLYTDGLIEVRRQSLDQGIGDLLATVQSTTRRPAPSPCAGQLWRRSPAWS